MIRRLHAAGGAGYRRGTVILAVLLVIVLASLVGTTVLVVADADRAGAETSLHRTQSRSLAWSGVQAVMAELAGQRELLLQGRPVRVTDSWVVTGGEGSAKEGMFRLIPWASGETLESESAKLDLNGATEAMLALVPGVGEDLARQIVTARARAPLTSVEELLTLEGVTAEQMYGAVGQDAQAAGSSGTVPLAALLTVFSSDPNVQLGLGPTGAGHLGELRFNINTPWTERLGRAVARRFGQEFADGLQGLMNSGRRFENDRDIVRTLIEFKVPPAEWVESFDAFTTSPDEYLYGRVDLTTAPPEVLACIPGIDGAAAARLASARTRLEADSLRSITWPVSEEILTPEQFELAADHLTTRSMQWRVRVESGFDSGEDGGELTDRMVLDAVIDLSSERPRVAYLRDITNLDAARAVLARAPEDAVESRAQTNREAPGAVPADIDSSGSEFEPARLGQAPARLEAARASRNVRFGQPSVPEGAESTTVPGVAPEAGPDRRIGRWNPGGGRQGGRR